MTLEPPLERDHARAVARGQTGGAARVQRQQVDERAERAGQLRQLVRLRERVVLPSDQHVLERHPAAELRQRLHHLGERVLLLDRHQLAAQPRRRGVQRHGEPELFGALRQPHKIRQDPDRGHGDVTRPDAETVGMVQDRERRVHRVPIEQRLAHAHEHRFTVGELPEEFLRPVAGLLGGVAVELRQRERGGELGPQRGGKLRCFLPGARRALPQAGQDLRQPVARLSTRR